MRAAILQSRTGIDPEASARVLVDAVARAAGEGADMLFTPEMSNLLDRNRNRAATHLTDEAGDRVLAAVREAAAGAGLWVHLGSLALSGERADGRLVNRGVVIDAAGGVRARYDKIHLFDVDLPTGESWRESAAYAPGAGAVTVDTPWGRLGLSICYDIRFPDIFRTLTDAGAVMLAVPAAFTVPTGRAHWHVLLRARAIESAAFVIAAAQTGTHEDGRETYGHSLAVDPWGEVIADLGEGEKLSVVDIDLDRIGDVRKRIPVIDHRRPIALIGGGA